MDGTCELDAALDWQHQVGCALVHSNQTFTSQANLECADPTWGNAMWGKLSFPWSINTPKGGKHHLELGSKRTKYVDPKLYGYCYNGCSRWALDTQTLESSCNTKNSVQKGELQNDCQMYVIMHPQLHGGVHTPKDNRPNILVFSYVVFLQVSWLGTLTFKSILNLSESDWTKFRLFFIE